MSFFIRVWVQGDQVPFINSRDDQITWDMVDIKPATVIDAEVDGTFLDAGRIREILSVNGGSISLQGRSIKWQSPSYRQ